MIEELLNPWIRDLVPYSSARSEFSGRADVFLDANESWEGPDSGINRYPDPFCRELRQAIAGSMGFPFDMTAIGNGSDEIIDLLIRMFAYPGRDAIMVERPTYGTYSVFASISGVEVIDVPLTPSLDLDENAMIDTVNRRKPKIVFICSPNNPTGRVYPLDEILRIADANKGITVVDEAYADFAEDFESAACAIKDNPRIVVLRTLSKAFGAAGARLGVIIADPAIQQVFMKAKPPYNVPFPSQLAGIRAVKDIENVRRRVEETRIRRAELSSFLKTLPYTKEVFPSEANFVLFRVTDASRLYGYLLERGIVVRNRSSEPMLDNTIRITIGSDGEMERLKEALSGWEG